MILTGARGDVEVRAAWPGFGFGGPISVPPASWPHASTGGVDTDDAMGVPAAYRAVALASEGVAGMIAGVFRGDGLDRIEVNTTWQARFFNGEPNDQEPWHSVWSQTEASLTSRNNAYWWLTYDTGVRVVAVQVIDPCLVTVKRQGGEKVFDVVTAGQTVTVDASKILHFRGTGSPGALVAPDPLDLFDDALGAAVARQAYETNFYANGMGQGIALIYPQDMTAAQAKEYKDALGPAQGGIANKVRVFGGGPTIQGIGITPRDAQFIEAMTFSVEDIARIYNVPASLLYSGAGKGMSSPLTPEHEMARWLRYGLGPRLQRIAAAINQSAAFFGAGYRDSFDWETQSTLRGDLATESAIDATLIQTGQRTVNELRARDGLPPVQWGDVPQATPVGGAPNPGMAVVGTGGIEPATEPAAELEE